MPRRQVTPSSRQSRRIRQRRMKQNNKSGSPNARADPNVDELVENEESEDSPGDAVTRGRNSSFRNPFAILEDSPPSLGRRKLNSSETHGILQQKKARIDLTADSDDSEVQESEEEITDSDSHDSAKDTAPVEEFQDLDHKIIYREKQKVECKRSITEGRFLQQRVLLLVSTVPPTTTRLCYHGPEKNESTDHLQLYFKGDPNDLPDQVCWTHSDLKQGQHLHDIPSA